MKGELQIVNREYENIIKALRNLGDQPVSCLLEDSSQFAKFAEVIDKLCDKYGKDKVMKDLGIK